MEKITYKNFKIQCKEICKKYGYEKKDVSITKSGCSAINVEISTRGRNLSDKLIKEIKALAGEGNNSDAMTDYFDNYTKVLCREEHSYCFNYIFVQKKWLTLEESLRFAKPVKFSQLQSGHDDRTFCMKNEDYQNHIVLFVEDAQEYLQLNRFFDLVHWVDNVPHKTTMAEYIKIEICKKVA